MERCCEGWFRNINARWASGEVKSEHNIGTGAKCRMRVHEVITADHFGEKVSVYADGE